MEKPLKTVLVPIADGTEEIEAVAIIDVLRRAGAHVTVASVGELQVTASRGVTITGDCRLEDCLSKSYDMIVLPGGIPGAENLRDTHGLKAMLMRHRDAGRPYAAICAAPAVVLEPFGLLDGRRATCHPSFRDRLSKAPDDARVVTDGLVTTSQGPGTALEFAIELVKRLFGEEKARSVAVAMVV
ncbi:MAG: DJ-1/PfpI family protein [Desulfobacterales bacterium]|jgi:4-methyl-5(b-hydroxyethyl)-thiazole monophosphate biosynthesis